VREGSKEAEGKVQFCSRTATRKSKRTLKKKAKMPQKEPTKERRHQKENWNKLGKVVGHNLDENKVWVRTTLKGLKKTKQGSAEIHNKTLPENRVRIREKRKYMTGKNLRKNETRKAVYCAEKTRPPKKTMSTSARRKKATRAHGTKKKEAIASRSNKNRGSKNLRKISLNVSRTYEKRSP